MIKLGIVGLGPVWESRYRPVLEKLRHRIQLRAVFDPIANRCELAAQQFDAIPYQGVLALLTESDVRGVLVLDTSWQGNELLHFLRLAKQPAYIAGSLGEDWDEIARLQTLVESEGLLVMPEFSRRFTPATCRLLELIATRLGRPRHIQIDATPPPEGCPDAIPGQSAGTDFLIGLLDWCCYVARSAPVRVESLRLGSESPPDERQRSIKITFGSSREPESRPTAEIRLHDAEPQQDQTTAATPTLTFTVQCERGAAVIEGPVAIRWRTDGPYASELLTADRPEVEVMIDHFCRRIVGGLIPIADISDVCRCVQLVKATTHSLTSKAPVDLAGNPPLRT